MTKMVMQPPIMEAEKRLEERFLAESPKCRTVGSIETRSNFFKKDCIINF